ncbi:MAG: STAS domain-containing protein, partial [Candidatus Zixiibacteriota bacterium]
RLHYELALLRSEIDRLKEKLAARRTALRKVRFAAVENADGTFLFYAGDELPSGQIGDGRNWRLRIGSGVLNDEAITMIGGGAVVGIIPSGLPGFTIPKLELSAILGLFPMAVIISLLGFMEAISIAKAMAAKTGQHIDPNQELIGQGLANIVGSAGQSYAVSGSFSRSAVNLQAGALSGMSNVFSSCVVMITLLFFTPWLYHLPQGVLAAIIMMAVIGLVNIKGFIHAWHAQKYDGIIGIISFVTTLAFAPHLDRGIMIGVVLSLGLHLLRSMKPETAKLSLHPDGTYRNAERFDLVTCRHIAVIRYNGSLFFANVNYMEELFLEQVANNPELKHILLVGNGINELDASGEEMLSLMVDRLREADIDISISGLNDQVQDVMRRTMLLDKIGEDHLYRNADRAIKAIHEAAHRDSPEEPCPLVKVYFKRYRVPAWVKRDPRIVQGPDKDQKQE